MAERTKEAQKWLSEVVAAHQAMRKAEETRRLQHVKRAAAINNARAAGMSLAEIARALQVTPERVRQMALPEKEK